MNDVDRYEIVFGCISEACLFMEDGSWEIFNGYPQWCPNCGSDVVYLH